MIFPVLQQSCRLNGLYLPTVDNLKIAKMRKAWLLFLPLILALSGCGKDPVSCTDKDPSEEDAAMLSYMAANGITGTRHSSGMYYQIINPGSGQVPTALSTLYVTYLGRQIGNNQIFDQQNDPRSTGFRLNSLIQGWQIGLPLVQEGGVIKLVIPSKLAYGCQGQGGIPANSPLYFEITVVDVQ